MRRGKAKSLEVELDSSGEFPRKNMMRSSLGNKKESRLVVFDKYKHQEDGKMYNQLPDYGDFQGYDLGTGAL